MSNKKYTAWADNATQCIADHRLTHDLLIFLATNEFSFNLCNAQFGANPNLLNVFMGSTPDTAIIAASRCADWVTSKGISPEDVTIWRDGKLQLEGSELCRNCGGVYDDFDTETALIDALRQSGFTVKVISCHTEECAVA
jgi:hypothetical protein